jgi:hypothetical protein
MRRRYQRMDAGERPMGDHAALASSAATQPLSSSVPRPQNRFAPQAPTGHVPAQSKAAATATRSISRASASMSSRSNW